MATLTMERSRATPFGGVAEPPRRRTERDDTSVLDIPVDVPNKSARRIRMESVVGTHREELADKTAVEWVKWLRRPVDDSDNPWNVSHKRPSREQMESVVGMFREELAGKTAAEWMDWLRGPVE